MAIYCKLHNNKFTTKRGRAHLFDHRDRHSPKISNIFFFLDLQLTPLATFSTAKRGTSQDLSMVKWLWFVTTSDDFSSLNSVFWSIIAKTTRRAAHLPTFFYHNWFCIKKCPYFHSLPLLAFQSRVNLGMIWIMHHIFTGSEVLSPPMSTSKMVLNIFFIFAWNWSYRGATMDFMVTDVDPDCLHINYWPICH